MAKGAHCRLRAQRICRSAHEDWRVRVRIREKEREKGGKKRDGTTTTTTTTNRTTKRGTSPPPLLPQKDETKEEATHPGHTYPFLARFHEGRRNNYIIPSPIQPPAWNLPTTEKLLNRNKDQQPFVLIVTKVARPKDRTRPDQTEVMTAVLLSSGASPLSLLDEDDNMPWHYVDWPAARTVDAQSLRSSSTGQASSSFVDTGDTFFPSPSTASQGSYVVVGHTGGHQQPQQQMRSFTTPSPILSHDNMGDFHDDAAAAASYSPAAGAAAAGPVPTADMTETGPFIFDLPDFPAVEMPQQPPPPQQLSFLDRPIREGHGEVEAVSRWLTGDTFDHLNVRLLESHPEPEPMLPEPILSKFEFGDFGWDGQYWPLYEETPWDPVGPPTVFENRDFSTFGPDRTPPSECSPGSIRPGHEKPHAPEPPAAIHAIPKTSSPRVHKPRRKKKNKTPPRFKSPDRKPVEDGVFTFCNQTPDTFGKASFGEVEQLLDRSSQKGRKGALSDEVRASALNVRKQGACFCCHIRKVKCDEQRPCKNCVKLCTQVPDAACWKFSEFTTILFPAFLREHFETTEMSQFVTDNIASFTINGADTPCTVTLSSGDCFVTKLTVKAKFFTPLTPTSDIIEHRASIVTNTHKGVETERYICAPIGLDVTGFDTGNPLRAELKRKVLAYMEGLAGEEHYAGQLNDITVTTKVPTQVLQLVQRYAQQAPEGDAAMVRRALGILALEHVMVKHLTLTPQSVAQVRRLCPQLHGFAGRYVTSRLLGRQIKQVVDECLRDLVPMLFDDFLKRLKSKSRKEWAPCVAAFLVFCILMEVVEVAGDDFTAAEQDMELRNYQPATFTRALALEANRHIENMPFKQFAYQFHQIYQTHAQDASAKSFNPLDARTDLWDLEPAALEFVRGLREGIDGNFPFVSRIWRGDLSLQIAEGELDWLAFDPLLPSSKGEDHPWPRDVGGPYKGRLVATFLLSFKDKYYLSAAA